mmetsp:Transcript_30749/g.77078  ORF Transcript_30749/g.77078 Transcript_30749/m.77078 type:complete len:208 (-) Transcript_30749:631-1254(-)
MTVIWWYMSCSRRGATGCSAARPALFSAMLATHCRLLRISFSSSTSSACDISGTAPAFTAAALPTMSTQMCMSACTATIFVLRSACAPIRFVSAATAPTFTASSLAFHSAHSNPRTVVAPSTTAMSCLLIICTSAASPPASSSCSAAPGFLPARHTRMSSRAHAMRSRSSSPVWSPARARSPARVPSIEHNLAWMAGERAHASTSAL